MIKRPQFPDLVDAMANNKWPIVSLILVPWQELIIKASFLASIVILRSVGRLLDFSMCSPISSLSIPRPC